MTVVLVHGNPETDAIWGPLVDALGRDDVVRLSPPGFGAPLPDDFPATYLAYRDWLEGELEGIEEPVDLVGHDWGGGHVVNLVMHRPELVRSWASDVVGLFDPDYVWHDLAQVWQSSGDGEQLVDTMLGGTVQDRAAQMTALGIPTDIATSIARSPGARNGSGNPAAIPLGAPTRDGRGWPGVAERLLDRDFHCWPPRTLTSAPTRSGAGRPNRAGAHTEVLDGLGHWWMVQDPARGAAAFTRFWETLG